jgi:hypothetical protein
MDPYLFKTERSTEESLVPVAMKQVVFMLSEKLSLE